MKLALFALAMAFSVPVLAASPVLPPSALSCQIERRLMVRARLPGEVETAVATPDAVVPPAQPGTLSATLSGVKTVTGDWNWMDQPVPKQEVSYWRFGLKRDAKGVVVVTTDQDIAQIRGKWQTIAIAPGQYAFVTVAERCTFTEVLCSALVQVSDAGNGGAVVTMMLTASSKIEGVDRRSHFQLVALGRCTDAGGVPSK